MGGALKVLMVEDSAADAARVLQELEQGGLSVAAHRVDSPQSLRAALAREPWDLMLTELRLPGLDALGALEILKAAGMDLPFIVVASTIPEDSAVTILKQGAHDVVRKEHLLRLVPAVERELREAGRRRQRAQEEEALNTSNYRLNIILDSLVEGVAQYDRSGRLQAANARARRFLPETRLVELERRSLNEEGVPWPVGSHPVLRALKGGEACTGVVMGIRKRAGALVWVSLNATPLLYRSREPWGVVVSFTDITEQRQVRRRREVVADLLQMAHQAVIESKLAEDMANRLALWSGCAAVAISIQDGPARHTHSSSSFPRSCPGPAFRQVSLCCNQASLASRRGDPDGLLLAELARIGFESVALLPVPFALGRQGLWQFMDPRPGCFDELPQAALEEVAGIAANILAKALAEQELRERADALARSRALLAQAQALAGLGSWELNLTTAQHTWSPESYLHWDCDPALPVPDFAALLGKVHPEDQEAFRTF